MFYQVQVAAGATQIQPVQAQAAPVSAGAATPLQAGLAGTVNKLGGGWTNGDDSNEDGNEVLAMNSGQLPRCWCVRAMFSGKILLLRFSGV